MKNLCNKTVLLSLLLFVSLAANFTIGGMVLGRGMMPPPPPHEGMRWKPNPLMMMEHKLDQLPDESADKARTVLESYRKKMQTQIDTMKKARKESFAYIESDQYNRAEAEKMLSDLSKKSVAMQDLAQQMMLDMADQLPAEERALLFKRDHPLPASAPKN